MISTKINYLLPLREKVAKAKPEPDEGDPSPDRFAITLSRKGRGEVQ